MITKDLTTFALEHQGRLPANKQEFEPYVDSSIPLDTFQICYGIHLNELNEKKGKLYDKQGNQILLVKKNIKIPFMGKKYEEYSLKIFETGTQ